MTKAKKKKMGRPPLPDGRRRKAIEVTLPTRTIDRARELGDGVISRGIEIAVERTQ